MTETSSLLATYPLPSSYSVAIPSASISPVPNGKLSPLIVDEEEYTIKCICGYNDDDGNTVFCEKCDTWQHIECYYHGKKVPEVHYCTDCAPKDTFTDINADKARERQRRARELLEGGGDRKVKRPTAKTQKKKHRDTITNNDLPNTWQNLDRQDSVTNGRDQPPPAKKPKTSHRPSGSIASLNGNGNGNGNSNSNGTGSGELRKRAHSNVQSYPSPSKSPQEYRVSSIPRYTPEFLELYDRDTGDTNARDNEHTIRGSLALTAIRNDLSFGADNPETAQNDKTPIVRAGNDWSEHKWPSVSVEDAIGKDIEVDGKTPTWKLLRLQSDASKNAVVGEVRGQIGTLDEYCQQLTGPNRWNELSHPDPFVFFHPHMDIYIDSRRTGTQFRYVRRSCDPNITMRTYITPNNEVHHCFVARHDIPAGTELTASWYLNQQLFHVASRDENEQLHPERCEYISRVLANFGDCACTGTKCHLGGFDRRLPARATEQLKAAPGKKKKTRTKHALSPLSNGIQGNSRAGSETVKVQDEDDDHRSSSGSSGNAPPSRDLTPQGGALLDEPPVLGNGLTQREIRKIQMMERSTKEQSQKNEKKQKKRPSGASNLSTPNPASRVSNVDLKRFSGSPPPSQALKDASNRISQAKQVQKRPVYMTAAVQTEPEPRIEETPLVERRKFCTPTQRLLTKLLQHRAQFHAASASNSLRVRTKAQSDEVEMKDATTSVSTSPSSTKSATSSPPDECSRQSSTGVQAPLPSQAAHTHKVHDTFKAPAPRLNLSTLPPVPSFPQTTSVLVPSVNTPGNSSTFSIAPSSVALPTYPTLVSTSSTSSVMPSPAKKKLSLGDYMSRRKESSTPVTEKSAMNFGATDFEKDQSDTKSDAGSAQHRSSDASAPILSMSDAFKASASEHEQAIDDSPMQDADSTLKSAIVPPSPENTTVSTSIKVQNMLSSLQEMHKQQSA